VEDELLAAELLDGEAVVDGRLLRDVEGAPGGLAPRAGLLAGAGGEGEPGGGRAGGAGEEATAGDAEAARVRVGEGVGAADRFAEDRIVGDRVELPVRDGPELDGQALFVVHVHPLTRPSLRRRARSS